MNVLDIIIIITMVFLVVRGLMRGFVREVASLAGVILGIFLAIRFQPQASTFIKSFLPPLSFLPLLSFAGIFLSVLIVCNLLGWGFQWLFKKALLGWVDRTLGVGLAVIKGVILTYLVIVLFTFFLPAQTPLIAQSRLAPQIISSYQYMVRLISPEHYQNLKRKFTGTTKEIGGTVSGKKPPVTEKP